MHFHNGRKKLEIQLRCLLQPLRIIRVSSALCPINLHRISLVQICLRGCHGDLGIYIYFGFTFSVYISVLCIPGHLPLITSDLMIVVISVWVYICYVLAGITAALEPAFKPKSHTWAIIYCETSDHVLVSLRDGQLCRPKQAMTVLKIKSC